MTALAEQQTDAGAAASGLPSRLDFAKYQGTGNDFVLLDARQRALPDAAWARLARQVCDRHYGVGADGLLLAAVPQLAGAMHRMRMFNPDGSESEMCGNGLRCFVGWLAARGELAAGPVSSRLRRPVPSRLCREVRVETGAGLLAARLEPDGRVAVDMGPPLLRPADIPLAPEAAAGQPPDGPVLRLRLAAPDLGTPPATCVSMGNPHAVFFVPDVAAVALHTVGPQVERHPWFPARTNAEFCQVLDATRLRVRVWERGAGITLACGTGACAAMVAARLRGLVGPRVTLELPGGDLEVEWSGEPGDSVRLRGDACHVFDGEFRVPAVTAKGSTTW